MDDKIGSVRSALNENTFLTSEFKRNIGTLMDTLITVFPKYDYSNFVGFLKSLRIVNDDSIKKYSGYEKNTNTLKINVDLVLKNRIDIQHLLLNELLLIGTRSYEMNDVFRNFNIGVAECISMVINEDESMKKLNPLLLHSISVFTKIPNADILIDSFMRQDYMPLVIDLEKKGIQKEEFIELLNKLNKGELSEECK